MSRLVTFAVAVLAGATTGITVAAHTAMGFGL